MNELVPAIAFVVSLAGLLAASYSDWKERLVDDKISYGLALTGLLLFTANAALYNDWQGLMWGVASGIGTFIAGYVLWHVGFWAGGDVKLFTGLAILNPVNFGMVSKIIGTTPVLGLVSVPVFPATLFLASVLALLPVGLGKIGFRILHHPAHIQKLFPKPVEQTISVFFSAALASLAGIVLGVQTGLAGTILVSMAMMGLFWLARKLPMHAKAVLTVVFLAAGFLVGNIRFIELVLQTSMVLAIVVFVVRLFFLKSFFRLHKKVSELKEGDISAATIVEQGGKILVKQEKGLLEILKNLKNPSMSRTMKTKERVICSGQSAGGLEPEQIAELQQLAMKGHIPQTIELKESTAFVPAVLLAYIALQALGDPWELLF